MGYLEAEKSKKVYKLNRNANVTVETVMKGNVYVHKITLAIEQSSMEPLNFADKEEIAKLIQGADLEDEQTDLFADSEE